MPTSIPHLVRFSSPCRNKCTYKVIVAKHFQMTARKTTSTPNAESLAQSMSAMEFSLGTNTMRHNTSLQNCHFISYQVKKECGCLRILTVEEFCVYTYTYLALKCKYTQALSEKNTLQGSESPLAIFSLCLCTCKNGPRYK